MSPSSLSLSGVCSQISSDGNRAPPTHAAHRAGVGTDKTVTQNGSFNIALFELGCDDALYVA